MSVFKKYQKITILLIFIFLFIGFGLFYNQNKKILAQEEEFVWSCGDEIPVGEAVGETLYFALAMLQQSQTVVSSSLAQANTAQELADLPEQCKAENCGTGCDYPLRTECTTGERCGSSCPPGKSCTEREVCLPFLGLPLCSTEYCWQDTTCTTVPQCEVRPCSGQACPFGEISDKLSAIQNSYSQVNAAHGEISRLIDEKRNPIIVKLNEARGELETCATPASGWVAEEQVQLVESLWSCEEAKYLKVLTEEQESCSENIYRRNNFFCCRPRVP